jgi:flagellar motor switch protein FliG
MTGKRKAAMLLMSLDAATATELLHGIDAAEIHEITMELARIDASQQHDAKEQAKVAQEFLGSLHQKAKQSFSMRHFLNETLAKVLSKDKAEEIRSQIIRTPKKKKSFAEIRSASTDELVLALEGEHPQTIAVVLSELDTKKSQEVLSLLSKETQVKAVCKMTNPDVVGPEVKWRIECMVSERLKSLKGETLAERPEQALRKLAIVLSGLTVELRDLLLEEIKKQDEQTCAMVRSLMLTWEDIPSVADRSLQEALRGVEMGKLALALHGADAQITQKIRSNISERAAATLDEEASLMQEPMKKEVLDAREEVVKPLREANEAGKLRFIGR